MQFTTHHLVDTDVANQCDIATLDGVNVYIAAEKSSGEIKLYKSTDGGASWSAGTTVADFTVMRSHVSMSMPGNNIIWIACANRYSYPDTLQCALSLDGGNTWNRWTVDTATVTCTSIAARDATTAYIAYTTSSGIKFACTSDGGATWRTSTIYSGTVTPGCSIDAGYVERDWVPRLGVGVAYRNADAERLECAFSYDGGLNWEATVVDGTPGRTGYNPSISRSWQLDFRYGYEFGILYHKNYSEWYAIFQPSTKTWELVPIRSQTVHVDWGQPSPRRFHGRSSWHAAPVLTFQEQDNNSLNTALMVPPGTQTLYTASVPDWATSSVDQYSDSFFVAYVVNPDIYNAPNLYFAKGINQPPLVLALEIEGGTPTPNPSPTFHWRFYDPDGDLQTAFKATVDDGYGYYVWGDDITYSSDQFVTVETALGPGTYRFFVTVRDTFGAWSGEVGVGFEVAPRDLGTSGDAFFFAG